MRSYPYINKGGWPCVGHPLFRIPIGSVLLSSNMYSIDYIHNFNNIKGNTPPWLWRDKHKIIYQGHSCIDNTTLFKSSSLMYWLKNTLVMCAKYGYYINRKINPYKFRYSIYEFPDDKLKYTIEYVYMIEQLTNFKSPQNIIHDMLTKLNEPNDEFRRNIIDSINSGYILKVHNILHGEVKLNELPYDCDRFWNLTFDVSIGNGFYEIV